MTAPNLATPYLLILAPVVRRNLAALAVYGEEHSLGIRPHTKTHKSQRVAAMQLEAGAVGLTVAKVGEAEVMSAVGDDLLVAYPTVDRARTERVAKLAMHNTVRVGVDSITAADALAGAARRAACTIGILVDLDVGFHRTGVQTPGEALRLAQHVDRAAGLRLDGLMFFPGHIAQRAEEQEPDLMAVADILAATLNLWSDHGLEASIVSGGSTPTAFQSHLLEDVTEIRPGTYVYHDMNCVRGGYCTLEECAARVISTVVSDAVPNQVVIDAGSKTLTSDRYGPAPDSGHGYILEYPQAKIARLSEEHGHVDMSACPSRPRIGEQVTVIPNHICPCVNLQDQCWWQEEDGSIEPLRVDARGKLS